MKTKNLIAYVLISLFVFSPFLNVESWAASRTVPIRLQSQPAWECNWMCESNNDVTCCFKYCSDDDNYTWYQVDKFCFADPNTNLPQK
jgi:hypothetical protein